MVELRAIYSQASIKQYIAARDRNNDGKVSVDEDPEIGKYTKKYDKNHDNALDSGELMVFIPEQILRGRLNIAASETPLGPAAEEKRSDDIKSSTLDREEKIKNYRTLLSGVKDKALRIKILKEIYRESALIMDEIGKTRFELLTAKYTKNDTGANSIMNKDFRRKMQELALRETKLMRELTGVVGLTGGDEGGEGSKAAVGELVKESKKDNNPALKNGLLYLKGRISFASEMIAGNYTAENMLLCGPALGAILESNGLAGDPEIEGARAQIKNADEEIVKVSRDAIEVDEKAAKMPKNSRERKALEREWNMKSDRLTELEGSKKKPAELIARKIREKLKDGISALGGLSSVLSENVSFRNDDPGYVAALAENYGTAYGRVKGMTWTYHGSVNAEGALEGDGGISCLGFVKYLSNGLTGGEVNTELPENVSSQAELYAGQNNNVPYPILADIPSSTEPGKLLEHLSSTGRYFAVQTYSPGGGKTALHAVVISVENINGKPTLVVSESTTLPTRSLDPAKRARSGTNRTLYADWIAKERKQSSGRGVMLSFVLIDPDKKPGALALNPMGDKPIRKARPITVASR